MSTTSEFKEEEKNYEQRLSSLATAALGENWRNAWPDTVNGARSSAQLPGIGRFLGIENLIRRLKGDLKGTPIICEIDNIDLRWTIKLGAGFDIDPDLFIEHFKPIDDAAAENSLGKGTLPNCNGGLKSSCKDSTWATIRGFADEGEPKRELSEVDLADTTKRRHEQSVYGRRFRHTNVSFYLGVKDLYIILVDRVPDWHKEFELTERRWFPNQTLIMLATLDYPDCLTLPSLFWTDQMAVFSFWTLSVDRVKRTILLDSLAEGDIDEFLYEACVMETEGELWRFSHEIDVATKLQSSSDSKSREAAVYNLKGLLQAMATFHASLAQNQQYEARLQMARSADMTKSPPRCEFKRLAAWAVELDRSIHDAFNRSMLMSMALGTEESHQKIEAMNQQLASTNEHARVLAHLAFVYVPLTFAAGMIGMSMKETHGSTVAFSVFGALAIAVAFAAFSMATACRVLGEIWGRQEKGPQRL